MLHINNACIAFGTEVLFSGLNLNLERGKTACIVGQSGCGKTSLLNAVMGFVPLKEGTIKVGDTLLDKSTIDIIRRQIAWIPQELALPFEWVKEMVALPFDLKVNRSVPFSEERLYEYFDDLDAGSTDKVLAFFRRQAEKGAAVLAVSHDKDFASGCHYLIEL